MVAKQLGLALAILSSFGLAEKNITSDTYFYGQSEPVYPSRMSYLARCRAQYLTYHSPWTGYG